VGEVVEDAGDGGVGEDGGADGVAEGGLHGDGARGHAVHGIDAAQDDGTAGCGGAERNEDDRELPDLAVVAGLVRQGADCGIGAAEAGEAAGGQLPAMGP